MDRRRGEEVGPAAVVGDPCSSDFHAHEIDGVRAALAARLEIEIRPLIGMRPSEGGYNCCGCTTYAAILDHAISIVSPGVLSEGRG